MKCPNCKASQKRSRGMTCLKCRYNYILDPKDGATGQLSDGKFIRIVKTASKNGSRYFTFDALHLEHDRAKQQQNRTGLLVVMLFGLFFSAFLALIFPPALVLTVPIFALGFVSWVRRGTAPLEKPDGLRKALQTWQIKSANQSQPVPIHLAKLIDEPNLHTPPPDYREGDLYDYGVERIVLADDPLLVDLLVRNGFHKEKHALIVAMDGYPAHLVPVARRLTEDSPSLPVFLIHAPATDPQTMQERAMTCGILPAHPIQLIDLGFSPEEVKANPKLKRFHRNPSAFRPSLLPYSSMTAGFGACFLSGIGFAELIRRQAASGGGSSTSTSFDSDSDGDFG
jgi:hypothetical protein